MRPTGFGIPISCFALLTWIVVSSCVKNQDDTASGPKAEITITNYVVNGAAFDILFNDNKIIPDSLSFDESVHSNNSIYIPVPAGLHNIKFISGNDLIVNKTISWEAGEKYSFFLYDSLKDKNLKTLLLTDVIVPVDTIAKARFLHFIPDKDSLTLLLTGDTLGFAISDTYMGNKPASGLEINFLVNIPPGNYQVKLIRKNIIIFELTSITILPGKVYSFIAKGVVNGTGISKESIAVRQHN